MLLPTRVSNLHLHMMKNDHPSVATHTTLIIFHSMRLLHLYFIKSHLISIVSSLGLISKNHMVDFIASSGLHGPSIVAMILFIVASLVHQHEALYSHFSTSTRLSFTLAHGPSQPSLTLIFTIFQWRSYVVRSGSVDPDDLAATSRTTQFLASHDPSQKNSLTPIPAEHSHTTTIGRPAAQRRAGSTLGSGKPSMQ